MLVEVVVFEVVVVDVDEVVLAVVDEVEAEVVLVEVEVAVVEEAVDVGVEVVPAVSPKNIPRPLVPMYTRPYIRGSPVRTLEEADPKPWAASLI